MTRIGTYLIKDPSLTPETRLRMIKAAGFDYVCLVMKPMLAGEDAGLTPELCARVGIAFDNVHLTGNGTHDMWAEGEAGDRIAERYCREIALCADYGVKTGIMHATWGINPPPPVGEIGLRRFARVVECAEKHNFTLALENSVSDTHLCYVLDRLKSPSLGYCFDSGHRNAFAPGADFLGLYGSRLTATHLQDNDGQNDLHLMPLDGCIDWRGTARQLAATPHGRRLICAEVAGVVSRDCPGRSASDIRAMLSRTAALEQGLVRIEDGHFTVYEGFSHEALLERLYAAMRKIADDIERESV